MSFAAHIKAHTFSFSNKYLHNYLKAQHNDARRSNLFCDQAYGCGEKVTQTVYECLKRLRVNLTYFEDTRYNMHLVLRLVFDENFLKAF